MLGSNLDLYPYFDPDPDLYSGFDSDHDLDLDPALGYCFNLCPGQTLI